MRLPKLISDALNPKPALIAYVHQCASNIEDITISRPEFFPEYTDHSNKHAEAVLETAISILTDDTAAVLTPEDYACLTASILLHDIGMHLTRHGFAKLIHESNTKLTFLDSQTWHELWSTFLFEAQRFDEAQLIRLFGTSDPIQALPAQPDQYNHRDKLLVGEFIRRNHPRLAHEAAIFGLPGACDRRFHILPASNADLNELSGLVARSHGTELRTAIDQLRTGKFHHREHDGVHPPILMAALRIADFLQIQSDRAPQSHLALNRIASPYSQMEWTLHQAVRSVNRAHDDPEAIFVIAEPREVKTFLKFAAWARSLQTELDATWAALGEVYGRFQAENYDKLGLRLRRVRTNIDDQPEFAKRATYVPIHARFEASSARLLNLLIGPLYGDRPQVGLRELIQNAADAVLERQAVSHQPPTDLIDNIDTDILISPVVADFEVTKVVVADRGIGMNAEIISDYFLKAGASFRFSPAWRKQFIDEDGKFTVLRSGRFGIGALACFLLGNRISVETRRADDITGYAFTAEIDTDIIQINKRDDLPVGTRITIDVPEEDRSTITELFDEQKGQEKWDWYAYTNPKVTRLDLDGTPIPQAFVFAPNEEWVNVSVPGYDAVWWQKPKPRISSWGRRWDEHDLYCNGIKILSESRRRGENHILVQNAISSNFQLPTPTIMINDKASRLPLNLQRDAITRQDANLDHALLSSMTRDLIAEAIAKAPETDPFRTIYPDLPRRQLSCDWRSDGMYRDHGPLHWTWYGSKWIPADICFARDRKWVCIFFNDIDLAGLNNSALIESTRNSDGIA